MHLWAHHDRLLLSTCPYFNVSCFFFFFFFFFFYFFLLLHRAAAAAAAATNAPDGDATVVSVDESQVLYPHLPADAADATATAAAVAVSSTAAVDTKAVSVFDLSSPPKSAIRRDRLYRMQYFSEDEGMCVHTAKSIA